MIRVLRFAFVSACVLTGCLAAAEAGRRVLDGYRVWSVPLVRNASSTDLAWSNGRSVEGQLKTIPIDLEADRAWFYDRPAPVAGSAPAWAEQRRIAFGPEGNYVWNAAVTTRPGFKAFVEKPGARLDEIFVFHAPSGDPFPQYRFHPEIQTGIGLTNRYGWRSGPISAAKPPRVIRIGFLGDSTTAFYPTMVEHWLNRWSSQQHLDIQFEVINAARPASGAPDAAAIVDYEFGSVDLDYIVVYGFGNGIYQADDLISLPAGVVKGQPTLSMPVGRGVWSAVSQRVATKLDGLSRWSASAEFLRSRLSGQRGSGFAAEPAKVRTRVTFPSDVDEVSPDPAAIARRPGVGLMSLPNYLQALDKIDAIAKRREMRVFVSTFRVMAFDGMLLGPADGNVFHAINEMYWWPYTYAQIRRLTDFYNRTLRTWADRNRRDIIPINEEMPWQPDLYGDGLHEMPIGEALHAWIVLQHLMPAIRDDLARHRLPRTAAAPRANQTEYWKIDRLKTTDLDAAPVAARPLGSTDEIAGAFALSALKPGAPAAEIVPGAVPLIRTTTEPLAYAAALPIEASVAAALTGKGLVRVRLRIVEGGISIGILDKAGKKFLAQSVPPRNRDEQQVDLAIDDLSDLGSLMISNNRPNESARSVVELRSATLLRFRQ